LLNSPSIAVAGFAVSRRANNPGVHSNAQMHCANVSRKFPRAIALGSQHADLIFREVSSDKY
jgi:hypothetical protein